MLDQSCGRVHAFSFFTGRRSSRVGWAPVPTRTELATAWAKEPAHPTMSMQRHGM
ncbi:hypothetical protein CPter91_3359 [Collimonas pratensis]|uniref:Uncharacterized protein n=1 Tax=Collimonas pratensis TaxID=279113 RepID=A0A127Q788_9BURK|nr:hypothetical protein CPter91_3359 [Collimonas pratensis]